MPRQDRVIFHIDCNAFYASVAELLQPQLKAVPMAVCGDPESRRGIILAKNQLAKGFGVKTAETIWQAKRKCPDLVLTRAHHDLYHQYCTQINAIYGGYTDRVERFGIDESWLDVTGSLHLFGGDAVMLADKIRRRVRAETGLTVSVGVSWNKVFAKLGSDYKKPDAVTNITRQNFRDIVWPLPVESMLMVGQVTGATLRRMGVATVGDLAALDPDFLRRALGKLGGQLHAYANGLDDSPVLREDESPGIQSVGNGMTFSRNLVTRQDIKTAVIALGDSVASRMRRAGVKGHAVQVTIKDENLKVITRQKTLDSPTYLAADLAEASMQLICAAWKIGVPIRMLTVTALKLEPEGQAGEQISLFAQPGQGREKQEKLEKTMDKIRDKYGKKAISHGSFLGNDMGIDE